VRHLPVDWAVDDLGPIAVHLVQLPLGAEGIVVVDNVVLGPAIGGVRMNESVTADEVARLARAMTIKNAVAGLAHGGGKSGIRLSQPVAADGRERVIRAFANAIRHLVDYVPGPDMGTDETAMAWMRDEIGRAVGLPAVLDGIPLDEIGATGYGLAVCADTLARAGRIDLDGARVAIQGFGAVGRHAAIELAQRGARIIAVSDVGGAVEHPDGLDLTALIAAKGSGSVADFTDAKPIARDELLFLDCDILVPAAQPNVINEANVAKVRARLVLQGANLPVTAGAESGLARRGVFNVPDVVANAGGVICAAVEYRGGSPTQAFAEITERIAASTTEMLDRMASGHGTLPRDAALAMAQARLTTAAAYRRAF
jgi:glutamate dehydrogenase/leucine dehydrogenase